jgi:hypothetical protein
LLLLPLLLLLLMLLLLLLLLLLLMMRLLLARHPCRPLRPIFAVARRQDMLKTGWRMSWPAPDQGWTGFVRTPHPRLISVTVDYGYIQNIVQRPIEASGCANGRVVAHAP